MPKISSYASAGTLDGTERILLNQGGVTKTAAALAFLGSGLGWFNARDYGATVNTAAIQDAIDACQAAGGGTVLIPGGTTGALTFPTDSSRKPMRLVVQGTLTLTDTLTLPGQMHLVGGGGASDAGSFATCAATALITAPTLPASQPAITCYGGTVLQNLHVQYGGGILLDGTQTTTPTFLVTNAEVVLDHVTVTSYGVPLTIDSFFWVWAYRCNFSTAVGADNPLYCAVRATSHTGAQTGSGLLFFYDVITGTYGFRFDTGTGTANQLGACIVIDGWTAENLAASAILIDTTYNSFDGMEVSRFTFADTVSSPYMIERIAGTNRIGNVVLKPMQWFGAQAVSNVAISGLIVEGSGGIEGARYTLGASTMRNYEYRRNGVSDVQWAGQGATMAPSIVYGQTYAVPQDVSTWAGLAQGDAVVTTGFTAPDGTATAARVVTTSSGQIALFGASEAGMGLGVGDWLIAGVWAQSTDDAKTTTFGGSPAPTISFDDGSTFDTGGTLFVTTFDAGFQIGRPWACCVAGAKIATLGGSGNVFFTLGVDPTYPTVFWMPWLMRIPAGNDLEAVRLIRTLRGAPSGFAATSGAVALYGHQALAFGANARISSGSATPNSAVVGSPGDLYLCTGGGSATTLWVKESGSGTNTGWVGK